jgi:hypothetical protein
MTDRYEHVTEMDERNAFESKIKAALDDIGWYVDPPPDNKTDRDYAELARAYRDVAIVSDLMRFRAGLGGADGGGTGEYPPPRH